MNEILMKFILESKISNIVLPICFACSLFTALAPPSITEKIPNPVMEVVNALAFNFMNAQNKITNMDGNIRHEQDNSNSNSCNKDC